MALTPEQQLVLKTAILAETDQIVIDALAAENFPALATFYNADSTFTNWRTKVSEVDIVSLVSPEATVWNWTDYINTSVAEKMAWERIFNGTFSINPSLPQVRDGIADIFSGPQGADQRAHLLAMGKEISSRIEELFATGTGTVGDPGTLVFEGIISRQEIQAALNT